MQHAKGTGISRQRWRGRMVAVSALATLLATMTFAQSAAASTRLADAARHRGAGGHALAIGAARGTGVPGSASAADRPSRRAAEHLSGISGIDSASGALSSVSTTVVHGGYTAAGVAMRNLGYGTITLSGVPAGATVVSARLLWDVLGDTADPSFAQGSIDGTPITGTGWASGGDPCWGNGANFSYEADVTAMVTGNGSYSLSGFATGESDGADPWNVGSVPPMMEGASLVVIYQLASMPEATIQIAAGAARPRTVASSTRRSAGSPRPRHRPPPRRTSSPTASTRTARPASTARCCRA